MKETLGTVIKKGREKKNISQRDLAKAIGVDNSYIAKIERDISKKPAIEILFKLARLLEINLVYLLEKAGYSKLEILEMVNIGVSISFDLKVFSIIDRKDLKNYTIENDVGVFLDIGKILDAYKNNKIGYEDTVKLINFAKPFYLDNAVYYFSSKGDIEIIDNEINTDYIDTIE